MQRIFFAVVLICMLCGNTPQVFAKTFVVVSDATWPPMEYMDEQQNIIGYAIDYLQAVAKETDLKIVQRNVPWDGIFVSLETGQSDIIASSVTITPERQKQFTFSDPYCEIRQALLVRVDTPIKTIDDLKGKKVGGQIGTTGIFTLQKAKVGAEVREYEDLGLVIEDLAKGRIDAVICDAPVARYYAHKHSGFANTFMVAFVMSTVEYYGFVVKKGNDALVQKLNAGIKAVKSKGIEKTLQAKWMGKQ